ncbi:MAG: hypothetical protein WC670_18865 [Pseudolabrys sp.]
MARVRGLYEDTAVPVAEIARRAGVTERTIYKYAAKGNWQTRYVRAPVKGAGGRFAPRAGAGGPVPRGIKATDPEARARAAAACAAASARHAAATAKADAVQLWEARRRAIDSVSAAMAAYNRFRKARAARGPGGDTPADRRLEALHVSHIEAAIACVEKLRA